MAAIMSSCTTIVPATVRPREVVHIKGFNSYSGLVGHNTVFRLGQPVSSGQRFAKAVASLRMARLGRRRRRGGLLSVTCSAAAEIFKIAAIMNGLVLIGVAVGFLLIRIEAAIEDSE